MYYRNDMNLSYVRILHASPDAPPVDIYIDGNLVFKGLAFGNFTVYTPIKMGDYKVEVYPEGEKGKDVLTQDIQVRENQVITVAAAGFLEDIQLVSYIESNPNNLPEGMSRLRVIHLSPDAPEMDVFINENIAFTDLGYLDATQYIEIPSNVYDLRINIAQYDQELLRLEPELKSQKVYTIYILGDASNLTAVQSLDGSTYIRY